MGLKAKGRNFLYWWVRPGKQEIVPWGSTRPEYLGTRATHYGGELSGIAQVLEGTQEVSMLAILTNSKPASLQASYLSSAEARQGLAPPRSEIEARIMEKLCRRPGPARTSVKNQSGTFFSTLCSHTLVVVLSP